MAYTNSFFFGKITQIVYCKNPFKYSLEDRVRYKIRYNNI